MEPEQYWFVLYPIATDVKPMLICLTDPAHIDREHDSAQHSPVAFGSNEAGARKHLDDMTKNIEHRPAGGSTSARASIAKPGDKLGPTPLPAACCPGHAETGAATHGHKT